MTWSEVVARPKPRVLRQFAGLWLVFFSALAGLRVWQGHADERAAVLVALALVVGVVGLLRPSAVRLIYTGWMIAAFPIGWTVSQLMLVVLFYGVFTPVGLVFRMMRRDALGLKRRTVSSYWGTKPRAAQAEDYFRQF